MMEKQLEVCWWDGSTVGHLINRGSLFFVYDEGWLSRGLNLSPLNLPFNEIAFNGAKGIDGVPGLIADCLPDSWGRKVARTAFARNKWGEPTTMSLLAWRGERGLGALRFRPPLREGSGGKPDVLEKVSVASLARGAMDIARGKPSAFLPQLARGGSAGGAGPKALVLAYPDGTLGVGEPDGEGRPCLLKFDESRTAEHARSEDAYGRMARAAGIRCFETELIEEAAGSDRRHLLVTRFDVMEGDASGYRFHFHSASGLLHKGPLELDYTDLFRAAIRLAIAPEGLRELARRMIFNVLASNQDDHGKNHAFLLDEETGQWSLTPAYDLTYSAGLVQRGTQVAGEVWPKAATMQKLCEGAGIGREEFRENFHEVVTAVNKWPKWASESGVPREKRSEIKSRLQRIMAEVLD
ncbi:type II toxin-antitoxin system HipA family toxin [soil metagenome]